MLKELRTTGMFTGLTGEETIGARKDIEDLIHLEEYYEIERQTVESR
jgi:hypothetical protein